MNFVVILSAVFQHRPQHGIEDDHSPRLVEWVITVPALR